MRIFFDANILFSAVKSDGAVAAFVAGLLDEGHECWVDGYVLDEARRNLMAKVPARLPLLDRLVSRLRMAAIASSIERTTPHDLSDKDRPVLAAAVALDCDVLVTGDRTHFGTFYGRSLAGVLVHSPRSLYDQLHPTKRGPEKRTPRP